MTESAYELNGALMKIVRDPHLTDRFIIHFPIRSADSPLNPTGMVRASGLRSNAAWPPNDFWFHDYAAKRLKRYDDAKDILVWLKTTKSEVVWQPVANHLINFGYASSRISVNLNDVALVFLQPGRANMFAVAFVGV